MGMGRELEQEAIANWRAEYDRKEAADYDRKQAEAYRRFEQRVRELAYQFNGGLPRAIKHGEHETMQELRHEQHQLKENDMQQRKTSSMSHAKAEVLAEIKGLNRELDGAVLLFETEIAGVQHRPGGIKLAAVLEVGDRLELTRETENRYDHSAVHVSYEGVRLGYVPATEYEKGVRIGEQGGSYKNKLVARLLDKDADVFAVITKTNPRADHVRSYLTMGVYLTLK
jgi:hypothetical protein